MRWQRSAAALGLLVTTACGRSYRDDEAALGVAGEPALDHGALADDHGARGGAPAVDECADDSTTPLLAAIATTSFTFVPPPVVALGQGFQTSVEPTQGRLASAGCVAGEASNNMLEYDSPVGTAVLGEGRTRLGKPEESGFEFARQFLAPSLLAPFNTKLAEQGPRSLVSLRSASVQLWTYFLQQEQRTPVSSCGDAFVSATNPSRALSFALKLTFASSAERDTFQRCFAPAEQDSWLTGDTTAASRYLVRHRVAVAIHVVRAAGDAARTRQILDATRCSAANLSACASTLDQLEQQVQDLFSVPAPETPLSELGPDWGLFSYELTPLATLP